MLKLSEEQNRLHLKAVDLSRSHRMLEWDLIQVLQKIDQSKLYKKLNCPSLFQYAVRELKFSEAQAFAFIAVARKALQIKKLGEALREQSLSVSKAVRITSALSESSSASELIDFAKTHSSKEIDFRVASLSPKTKTLNRVKPISETEVQVTITISKGALKKLERVQALEAQRGKKSDQSSAVEAAFDEYLFRLDPLEKAKRATTKKPCSSKAFESKRVKLPAVTKHQITMRDKGQCTHVDAKGVRCTQDRWLETHHIVPLSQGGSNELSNLATLCSFHHDLAHQLSLPLEGQVTWLREPRFLYGTIHSRSRVRSSP